jgi:hypothetical protein
MLLCNVHFLEHSDIIGFNSNDEFVAGEITKISKVTIPPNEQNKETKPTIYWDITIKLANGEEKETSLIPKEKVMLIHMADNKNPARTRNHKPNWPSIGIVTTKVNEILFKDQP